MKLFYRLFKALIRFSLNLYFKNITIEGLEHVPKNAPVIITPNHQNAFLDALLIGAFFPEPIHFLTRSDVFKKWVLPFFKALNMLPVYRIRDGYGKLNLNNQTFEECNQVLKQNGKVLIFSEGNHGAHHYLRPLTKGTARLAFGAKEVMDQELYLLPVGLNFFKHTQPISSVLIVFGKPIPVSPHYDHAKEHKAKALIELTEALSAGMKETLVIPEQTEDYEDLVNQRFNELHAGKSLAELRSIKEKASIHIEAATHRLARVFNPLPFLIIAMVINKVEDTVFHSSLKFAIGLFLFPIWWLVVFIFYELTCRFKNRLIDGFCYDSSPLL